MDTSLLKIVRNDPKDAPRANCLGVTIRMIIAKGNHFLPFPILHYYKWRNGRVSPALVTLWRHFISVGTRWFVRTTSWSKRLQKQEEQKGGEVSDNSASS